MVVHGPTPVVAASPSYAASWAMAVSSTHGGLHTRHVCCTVTRTSYAVNFLPPASFMVRNPTTCTSNERRTPGPNVVATSNADSVCTGGSASASEAYSGALAAAAASACCSSRACAWAWRRRWDRCANTRAAAVASGPSPSYTSVFAASSSSCRSQASSASPCGGHSEATREVRHQNGSSMKHTQHSERTSTPEDDTAGC